MSTTEQICSRQRLSHHNESERFTDHILEMVKQILEGDENKLGLQVGVLGQVPASQ